MFLICKLRSLSKICTRDWSKSISWFCVKCRPRHAPVTWFHFKAFLRVLYIENDNCFIKHKPVDIWVKLIFLFYYRNWCTEIFCLGAFDSLHRHTPKLPYLSNKFEVGVSCVQQQHFATFFGFLFDFFKTELNHFKMFFFFCKDNTGSEKLQDRVLALIDKTAMLV